MVRIFALQKRSVNGNLPFRSVDAGEIGAAAGIYVAGACSGALLFSYLTGVVDLVILLVRRNVPESPRWLFIHCRDREAEELVADIEATVEDDSERELEPVPESKAIAIGNVLGPILLGHVFDSVGRKPMIAGTFIGDGIRAVAVGYHIGAGLMILAGLVELFLGVKAERQSLEDIATPLSAEIPKVE
ncbi:hypothetical protein ACSAGD_01840 [Paramicrobacterium sp. CJ85]|uniref:hypothetical protein n=1 Tax=Paramicrobacterium sp. CJ85 TaxID=3445355 RepID=UPI003F60F154